MKAITVRLPWAWAIAERIKRLEVRSALRGVRYRGPVLICAGGKLDDRPEAKAILATKPPEFWEALRGKALCVVDLTDCRPGTEADTAAAMVNPVGRNVWQLDNARHVQTFPVKGQQGWFSVSDDLIKCI